VREGARAVFAHRARYGAHRKADEIARVWRAEAGSDGLPFYKISREHPTVAAALGGGLTERKDVEHLLKVVEETVPVQRIWLDTAENEGEHAKPFGRVEDGMIRSLMVQTYNRYRERLGLDPEEAKHRVLMHEEFQDFASIVATLDNEGE
jgi:hypothetical protein